MSADPASAEEAVELFLERRRGGEDLDPAAFAAQYPGLGPDLQSALEALTHLEEVARPVEPLDLAIPARVGSFRVVRLIGRGGMGVVLEAVEEPLGRRVALKVLPPEMLSSPSARARFRREAELAARLDHSGIATIYGAGVEADQPWIAMRYVEGRTLARAIAAAREEGAGCVRLAPSAGSGREAALGVASLVARVARALSTAHEQGVVHRDVKPSNIMVTPDGSPVLLDFGLAIGESSDGRSLTRTGDTAGTPAYLPPESVGGEIARPDAQSDVYAMGVTLYECLALTRPFDAATPAALYHAILTGSPPGVRALNRAVPRDLAVVVATAMERDRARRYLSAAALADDLEACAEGRPIAARPVPLHGRALRWARREPRLALAITASVVIAIGGLAWVWLVQAAAARAVARKNADLTTANASLASANARAEADERVAAQKADDVLSLSALQDLQDLIDRADRLWPARPESVGGYEAWLRDARALLEGRPADDANGVKARPGLEDHRRKLTELEQRALPPGSAERNPESAALSSPAEDAGGEAPRQREWSIASGQDRWWHAQLSKLVAELEIFSDPETGLCSSGISKDHGWGIEKRLEFARTIEERSVSNVDASRRWAEAIASIRDRSKCPRYGGLVIAPQLGLLPIGRDPASGLWEFAHLETGEPPERGEGGKLLLKEETGVVLVLIPGGTSEMGAQVADAAGSNYDPQADVDESPPVEVTLAPFFLSKYEMTQGQWLRFKGRNPSEFGPGSELGEKRHDLRHPVEQVGWTDCAETLSRLGLELPTEAQWEYGARAGTSSAWWTGDAKESLAGAANLADGYCQRHGGPGSWVYESWLDDGYTAHAPVGTYRPNGFGLHDVLGNVWEWCRDGYGSYGLPVRAGDAERQVTDPRTRVVRGGGWNVTAISARSAHRLGQPPESRSGIQGLRPGRRVEP